MIEYQMEQLNSAPTLGDLVGTIGSTEMIKNFNSQWGNSGVIFGGTGDPYKANYSNLQNVLNNTIIPTQQRFAELEEAASRPVYKAITSEEELRDVDDNMKLPILLYQPVRELFEKDKIYGYGFNKDYLPPDDMYDRIIKNFSAEYSKDHVPEWIVAEHSTIDPDLTDDDVDAIAETRNFLDGWLKDQLEVGGRRTDPTDIDNKIKK